MLADYFIIANGNSDSQVNALVDNVEEELHKAGYPLRQRKVRHPEAGCCSTSAISLFMYLTKKTVSSMIWRGFGKTGRISRQKICNLYPQGYLKKTKNTKKMQQAFSKFNEGCCAFYVLFLFI